MHLIAVVDENWGLGRGDDLLFSLQPDMKRFRELTTGGVVIMGRKTLQSFPGGRPLKNRINLVLSKQLTALPAPSSEGTVFCSSPAALADALMSPLVHGRDIWLIGGAAIYRLLLPYAEDAYITHVYADGHADCFLPDLSSLPSWSLTELDERQEYEGLSFAFARYENSATRSLSTLKLLS